MGPTNVDDDGTTTGRRRPRRRRDDGFTKQTPFSKRTYLRNAGVRVCACVCVRFVHVAGFALRYFELHLI